MGPEGELVLVIGVLHLAGMALAALLLVMFMRSDSSAWRSNGSEGPGDGGSGDRADHGPSPRSGGDGPPLPDAGPAPARLRGPGRLAGARAAPSRRPEHAPRRRAPARRTPS